MNFVQMLMMNVSPLQSLEEIREGERKRGNPVPNSEAGYRAKREQAEARYRQAMGTKWMRTRDIETRLGHSVSTARDVLVGMMNRGLIERRPAGGGTNFNRKEGYEWRFKD